MDSPRISDPISSNNNVIFTRLDSIYVTAYYSSHSCKAPRKSSLMSLNSDRSIDLKRVQVFYNFGSWRERRLFQRDLRNGRKQKRRKRRSIATRYFPDTVLFAHRLESGTDARYVSQKRSAQLLRDGSTGLSFTCHGRIQLELQHSLRTAGVSSSGAHF